MPSTHFRDYDQEFLPSPLGNQDGRMAIAIVPVCVPVCVPVYVPVYVCVRKEETVATMAIAMAIWQQEAKMKSWQESSFEAAMCHSKKAYVSCLSSSNKLKSTITC